MISKVERNDIAECVSVIRESFMTVADEFGVTSENAPRYTAFATTPERLLWHMDSEHRPMYVWRGNGRIAGYYSLLIKGTDCELNNLCVLPAYRHGGIGRALLLHSFETARTLGCTRMDIGIMEENTVIKSWYEKYGFVHTKTEKYDFFPFTCGYMTIEL